VFLNYSRKTTVGMVSDKLVYDVIGFSCLSVYSVAFFYVGSVRAEYRDHNNGNNPKVAVNDVFFALHALLFAFVQIGQMCYYDGKKQYPSLLCLRSSAVVSFIIVLYLVLVLTIDSSVFIFLYWLDFISFVKIGVTLVKYMPQAFLNRERKCTTGWSITACTLDLIGSTLSILQLMLDCNDTNDWGGILGDLVKIALGVLSMAFDFIFMAQHYVLYPSRDGNEHYEPILKHLHDEDDHQVDQGEIGQLGPGDSGAPVYYTDESLWTAVQGNPPRT
jgi:cystinosin